VNEDGVLVTGGDNGSLWFWDWKSGHNFQKQQAQVQVFCSSLVRFSILGIFKDR